MSFNNIKNKGTSCESKKTNINVEPSKMKNKKQKII